MLRNGSSPSRPTPQPVPRRAAITQPLRKLLGEPIFLVRGARRLIPRGLPILAYHSIDRIDGSDVETISPEAFSEQMDWLATRDFTVTGVSKALELLRSGTARAPLVALTFDDGYLDNQSNALPILRRLGFSATLYVPTAFLGGVSVWNPVDYIGHRPLVSARQLSEFVTAGIEVGSHGHNHVDLTEVGRDTVAEELTRSKEVLEGLLGRRVVGLAAPFGRVNALVREVARDLGYSYVVAGGRFGLNDKETDPFCLTRIAISRGDSVREVAKKTTGAYAWLRGR